MLYIEHGQVVGREAPVQRPLHRGRGRVKVEASLPTTQMTSWLVTGATMQAGQAVRITTDWPTNFGSGKPLQVTVGDNR